MRCEERVARHDVEREQEVLDRHVLVVHRPRLLEPAVERGRQLGRDPRLLRGARDGRLLREHRLRLGA